MVLAAPEERRGKIIARIPVGSPRKPEGGDAAYLVSDEAAFVAGAVIAIHGGQYMH